MFNTEENQSEQSARFLINTFRKAISKGDLQAAKRRLSRVKAIVSDRQVNRQTAGELLLVAAGVARACDKKDEATELVMEILHGSRGGISIEILGRAKRLRARMLLDEGKLDEAEVLAGTADRYIVTGLMEEKIEQSRGRELRVNVPVAQKFLDHGEYISFETYFLLAEISVLENNWGKALWNIERAEEKLGAGRVMPELSMWRGIISMAKGQSFIEAIEPVLSEGKVPANLVGRIEALLHEPRRDDSPINEAEFDRFRQISDLARQYPLLPKIADATENDVGDHDLNSQIDLNSRQDFYQDARQNKNGSQVIEADLSRLSMMRLVEICDIERVTGFIALKWNQLAVKEGIDEKLLDETVTCGSGLIYCQNGRFVDAELLRGNEVQTIESLPSKREQSRFCLKQLILIALGAGSTILSNLQKGGDVFETSELPEVYGSIENKPQITDRENNLEIISNLSFFLDVSKDLDEARGIFTDDDQEIDWDADWEPQSFRAEPPTLNNNFSPTENINEQATNRNQFLEPPPNEESKIATLNIEPPDSNELSTGIPDNDQMLDIFDDNFELSLDDDLFFTPQIKPGNDPETQPNDLIHELQTQVGKEHYDVNLNEFFNDDDFTLANVHYPAETNDIAPPWRTERGENDISSKTQLPSNNVEMDETPSPNFALSSEEINILMSGVSWSEVNNNLAVLLNTKMKCGVRLAIRSKADDLIVSLEGEGFNPPSKPTNPLYENEFVIVEKIKWILTTYRELSPDEKLFVENICLIGRLRLLNLDYLEDTEIQSVGGVAIADDEWLTKFMVPPRSLVMRKKVNEAKVYASQDGINLPKAHILLGGETGTGKDVFANVIHELSGRRAKKLVRADLGAIGGGDQFLATLFGAAKGAYTGQVGDRRGLIEEAEGGTLFLNEIGNVSLESQRALLDFMQEGSYSRMGETKMKNADVRIILATNENINDSSKFRQDVKFRCAPPIILPPLRDRPEDIASLAVSFAGEKVVLKEASIKILEFQEWPGNVRELSQVINTAVARIGGSGEIKSSLIEEVLQDQNEIQNNSKINFPVPPSGMNYSQVLQAYEKFLVEHSLKLSRNKKSAAASLWGETPPAMTKKMKKWNITIED